MELRLKQARILKGETLRDSAKNLGMSFQMLHKYEKGLVKIDSEKLNAFANYYGVSIDYLIPNLERPKVELKNIQFHKVKNI